MPNLNIRKTDQADLSYVVYVHLEAFEGFFLSFLGSRFLEELYRGIICDPSGIFFVAQYDDRIVGFVMGTDNPSGFYSRLVKRRWLNFAFASLSPVIRQPKIIPRLLRAFNLPNSEVSDHVGTLLSIAVLPEAQMQGIGKSLVEEFLTEAKRRNLKQVNLSTDRFNNDPVNQFYRNLGFSCNRSFITPENREMNEYWFDLTTIGK